MKIRSGWSAQLMFHLALRDLVVAQKEVIEQIKDFKNANVYV